MPVVAQDGVTLRPCNGWVSPPAVSATESHHATLHSGGTAPPSHHDQHEEEQQGADQLCSFALASLYWPELGDAGKAEPYFATRSVERVFPSKVMIGRGLAAPPPPPTGPPLLS
jgi:hypothetical protein